MATPHRGHAVVLGAGIAGLLAARVAAQTYDRITVVDRDELTDSHSPRRGVPQGRHAHALLAGGRQALEELLLRPRCALRVLRHRPDLAATGQPAQPPRHRVEGEA